MNKKLMIFLLLSILMISLLAGFAEAKPIGEYWDDITGSKILRVLTVDMVQEFNSGSPSTEAQVVAKLMFVILFFAILFGASSIAPPLKNFSKNNRIVITLLLSLIAGMSIPTKWLTTVVLTYGGLFILALMFLPAIVLIYANFKWVTGKEREVQFTKFLFMVGLLFILHHAGNIAEGMNIDIIETSLDILEIIFGFLALWYLFAGGIFGLSEEVKSGTQNEENNLFKKVKEKIGDLFKGEENEAQTAESQAENVVRGRKKTKLKKEFEEKLLGYFDTTFKKIQEAEELIKKGDQKGANKSFGQAKRSVTVCATRGIGFLNKFLKNTSDPTTQDQIKGIESSLLKLRDNMNNTDLKKFSWFLKEHKKIVKNIIAGITALLEK